jgi:glycosyltransferase involved in cell wall biosynthesis
MIPTTLSIVIPVFNEEKTILLILEKVAEVQLIKNTKKEIILVNDCSSDNSRQIIQEYSKRRPELDIKYFEHQLNQGKGAAIHSGIQKATGEFLIIQDADLEYDPEEYNDLLLPMLNGFADVVYGSRFRGGKPHRNMFFFHSRGNKILTLLSNLVNNQSLTDMETCYKLFKTEIIKNIPLTEKRFGFEPEVTAKLARQKNLRIYEVGISYYGRTYQEGKKIGWKDGFRAIYCIIKYGLLRY